MSLMLIGCGNPVSSLEGFEAAYSQALEQGRSDELYGMLDSSSRRRIDKMLDTIRGFDSQAQSVVLQQLGAGQISNLEEMSPQAFFGLWWNAVLGGKQPIVEIQQPESGATSTWMSLSLEGRNQRMRLIQESGHWVWQLPQGIKTSTGQGLP